MLNLNQLNTFICVVKYGSFSKAAVKLYITQPTVTMHINSLECHLNCTLLVRSKKKITLTPTGKDVLKHAQAILQECNLLEETVYSLRNVLSGKLIIGASRTIGEYYLTNFNKMFADKYDVAITMLVDNTEKIIEAARNDDIGFGLVEGNIAGKYYNNTNYDIETFAKDEMVVVVPNNHDLFSKKDICISDVLKYPIILREEGSGTRRIFEEAIVNSNCKTTPLIYMVLGSTEAIKATIKTSTALAVLSNLTIRAEMERNELTGLKIRNISLDRTFKVFRKITSKQNLKENTYIKELFKYASKDCISE